MPLVVQLVLGCQRSFRSHGSRPRLTCARLLTRTGPGECFRAAPVQLARAWHPLAVKAVVTLRPPLQYRGGHLVELLKPNGPPQLCGSYRDVTLSDVGCKIVAKTLRPAYVRETMSGTPAAQMGSGLHCGATDTAHLTLRLAFEAYHCSDKCVVAFLWTSKPPLLRFNARCFSATRSRMRLSCAPCASLVSMTPR